MSCSSWDEQGSEGWLASRVATARGGITGGGVGGVSGVARALTHLGPEKTIEESVGFQQFFRM